WSGILRIDRRQGELRRRQLLPVPAQSPRALDAHSLHWLIIRSDNGPRYRSARVQSNIAGERLGFGTRMNLDYRVKQESITDIRVGDEFASIASPLDPLGPGASDVVSPLASGHFGSHEATTRQTDHLKRAVGGGV